MQSSTQPVGGGKGNSSRERRTTRKEKHETPPPSLSERPRAEAMRLAQGDDYRRWRERTAGANSQFVVKGGRISIDAMVGDYKPRGDGPGTRNKRESQPASRRIASLPETENAAELSPNSRNRQLRRAATNNERTTRRESTVPRPVSGSAERASAPTALAAPVAPLHRPRIDSLNKFLNEVYRNSPLARDRVDKIFKAVLKLDAGGGKPLFIAALKGAIAVLDEDHINALKQFFVAAEDAPEGHSRSRTKWMEFGKALWHCVDRVHNASEELASIAEVEAVWKFAHRYRDA